VATSEFMRDQAARLLAMAKEARRNGNLARWQALTDAAARYLDKANETLPPTPEQQQPDEQQPHQNQQPDKDKSEDKK
jgi:hypothetical protein